MRFGKGVGNGRILNTLAPLGMVGVAVPDDGLLYLRGRGIVCGLREVRREGRGLDRLSDARLHRAPAAHCVR